MTTKSSPDPVRISISEMLKPARRPTYAESLHPYAESLHPVLRDAKCAPPKRERDTWACKVCDTVNQTLGPLGKSCGALTATEKAGMRILILQEQHILLKEMHYERPQDADPKCVVKLLLAALDPSTTVGKRFAAFICTEGDDTTDVNSYRGQSLEHFHQKTGGVWREWDWEQHRNYLYESTRPKGKAIFALSKCHFYRVLAYCLRKRHFVLNGKNDG